MHDKVVIDPRTVGMRLDGVTIKSTEGRQFHIGAFR